MARRKFALVKFNQEEMDYEIPPVQRRQLRRVGRGRAVIESLAERSRRVILLEPDVFKDFRTAKEVNQTLRLVQMLRRGARSKKAA